MSRDASRGFARFPTTQWSLVGRAGQGFDESQRQALNDLLVRYWPALKAHLVGKKRIDPHEADDFVQEFIENKILERNLVEAADSSRGRFRNLLATALDNFVSNRMAQRRTQKRQADRAVSLDDEERQHWARTQTTPDQILDVAWAREVLAEALRRMKKECTTSGRTDVWEVFEGRILAPILDGADPIDYEALVQRFGFQSPSQASNVLMTAKRAFSRVMRDVVSEYVADPQELESEIHELREILSRRIA